MILPEEVWIDTPLKNLIITGFGEPEFKKDDVIGSFYRCTYTDWFWWRWKKKWKYIGRSVGGFPPIADPIKISHPRDVKDE